MALVIQIINEAGEKLDELIDEGEHLSRSLPSFRDSSYCFLNTIDLYGDTVFNRIQASRLIEEIERLLGGLSETAASRTLRELSGFARRVGAEPHMYLKIIGD